MSTNSIQVLKQTELLGRQFTVYGTAENPLFLAKDVAECIDYAKRSNGSYNTTMMLQSVDEEEKVANIVDTLGGNQQVWFLTEDGLYEVLMQSRKPIAKQFKKGVKQILHEVRTTGGYIATHQDDTPEEIKQAAPKVSYYDNHLQSVNTLTSTQVAKQIGMDAEKLHRKMKEIGILYKQSGQWILHAPYSTWGLHSTRTQTYTRSDGSTGTSVYTVWTTKGVRFIIALYENEWNVKKAIKQIKSEVNPAA